MKNHALHTLGIEPPVFVQNLLEILIDGGTAGQQRLLIDMETLFRREGYGDVFDAWGKDLAWMKG